MKTLFGIRPSSLYAGLTSLAFGLLMTPAWAQGLEEKRMTLEEAVRTGLEQNLGLQIQEQDVEAARADLLQARIFPNPELELGAETDALFSNEGEGTYSIGLGQTLFIGPKRAYRIRIAQLNMDRTGMEIEYARRLLTAEIKEAFYTLLLLQEKLKLAEDLFSNNKDLVRLSEGRFQEGFSPELDVNLARIQLHESQRNRTLLEKDRAVAKTGLNLLLGRSSDSALRAVGSFSDEETPPESSGLIEAALGRRADLKAGEVALDIAGREIDLAKAERTPDVTLSLEYLQEKFRLSLPNTEISERGQLTGIKLSVPLPLFDRNQGEIVRTRAQREKADRELLLLRAMIEKEVTDASMAIRSARKTLTLFGDGILPLAGDHLVLSQTAYGRGQAGILDVIEAQRRYSETRAGYLEALYDYNLALVEMERIVYMDFSGSRTSGDEEGGRK